MPPHLGCTHHVRSAREAIALIETGQVVFASLDNDLGDPDGDGLEGRHVALRIEELAFHRAIPPIEVRAHSMNPVGRAAILAAVAGAERFWAMARDAEGGR